MRAVDQLRVLITGGSGFIGRNLAADLASRGHEVLAPSHAQLELLDAQAVKQYVSAALPDIIVHAATKPGHRNAPDSTGLLAANLAMFDNLAACEGDFGRLLFIGSGAVYDAEHYLSRMAESYMGTHVPADEHGYSKYLIARRIEERDDMIDLRVFGVFGPHEDYAIRFISNAICKTIFDLPVTLRQDREFSYLWVADLAGVVEHFMAAPRTHPAYNVVPDEVSRLRDLAERVIAISGRDVPLLVAQPGEGTPYSGDNARLHAAMPQVTFTPTVEAVEHLYRWYSERRDTVDVSCLLVDK